MQDVFLASSTDSGRTFSANARVTDRSIDRSIGIWGNNIGSHHNVGAASRGGQVYFAWQDTRAGDAVTGSEDVYMSALRLDDEADDDSGSSGTRWGALLAGGALGMGVAMVLAWDVARRSTGG